VDSRGEFGIVAIVGGIIVVGLAVKAWKSFFKAVEKYEQAQINYEKQLQKFREGKSSYEEIVKTYKNRNSKLYDAEVEGCKALMSTPGNSMTGTVPTEPIDFTLGGINGLLSEKLSQKGN